MSEPAAGIDVSKWQGSPQWEKVAAAGIRFAYIKASEGGSPKYSTTDAQHAGARKAGLAVGLYHYAQPAQSATSNADALAAQVNRLGAVEGHLPPCLDLEVGTGNLAAWAKTFIARLRARTGCRKVMVYSGAAFFQDHIGESWMDEEVVLWIAHYGREPGKPRYLSPRVAIHQYSQSGRVNGVAGDCDLNAAIWPLEKLIVPGHVEGGPAVVDRNAQLDAMITGIYHQLSGSPNLGEWPGWPSFPNGSGHSLTLVDYLRQQDVQLQALIVAVEAIRARLDAQ